MQLELHINNTNIKSKCISKTISKIFYKWILWEVISFEPQQLRHWGKLMWLLWPPVSSRHIYAYFVFCVCVSSRNNHIYAHSCIFAFLHVINVIRSLDMRHKKCVQIMDAQYIMRKAKQTITKNHFHTWPKIYGKNGVQRTMVLPAVDIFEDHNGLKWLWWSIDHRIW